MITATTRHEDKKQLDRLEKMLTELGEAAQAVLPEGTTIDIKETTDKGNYEVFDKQIERTNSEISKQILGGTMVSDAGSSRSQSEVHERTLDDKIAKSDRVKVEFTVNNQLLKILATWGFPFTENDLFAYETNKKMELKELWQIVKELLSTHDIPVEWISKTFNIPIDAVKKKEQEGVRTILKQPSKAVLKAKQERFSNYPTDYFASADNDIVYQQLAKESTTILKRLWREKKTSRQELSKMVLAGTWLREGLYSKWSERLLKIDYDATDHVALAAMEYNLFHFSKTRELATIQQLNKLLINKKTLEIVSFTDFAKAAQPLLSNANKHWLRTEFNHAVAVGQNASAYHRIWNEKDTVTKLFQYQTIGDANVRPEHDLLDGKVFNIEDSEARRLIPPNGWGCRCEIVQYMGDNEVISGKEGIKIIKGKNLTNKGELNRVFDANENYIKYSTGKFDAYINRLNYKDFNKLSYSRMTKLPVIKLDSSIIETSVRRLFKPLPGKDYMGYTDHLGRKIQLKKKTFEKHTKGKYIGNNELRHQLVPHIADAIGNADEVYLQKNKAGKIQYRYIKFYSELIFAVDIEIANNLIVKTWYQSKIGDNIRNGLLTN